MIRVRRPDDPWWTALMSVPRVHWWAPAAVASPLVLLVSRLLGEGWPESLLSSGLVGGLLLATYWGGAVRAETPDDLVAAADPRPDGWRRPRRR